MAGFDHIVEFLLSQQTAELVRIILKATHETLEVLGDLACAAFSPVNAANDFGVVIRNADILSRVPTGQALANHVNKRLPYRVRNAGVLALAGFMSPLVLSLRSASLGHPSNY